MLAPVAHTIEFQLMVGLERGSVGIQLATQSLSDAF